MEIIDGNKNISAHSKKRKFLVLLLLGVTILIAIIFFIKTKEKADSPIFGTYRIFTNDRMVNMYTAGEDIYIKLNADKTIIYNTTMNGKPKFHIEGQFSVDEKNNTLAISWKSGKLPPQLAVEKEGEDYLIKIGETVYKKERK